MVKYINSCAMYTHHTLAHSQSKEPCVENVFPSFPVNYQKKLRWNVDLACQKMSVTFFKVKY